MDEIAIVTGASSGLGKEIARELARMGYRLGLVCRSPVRGRDAVADIERSVPEADVELFQADLSVQADVRDVAARLLDRYERIDALVNNAGVHNLRAKVSADGYDRMIATNHLGPFLLTTLLLEALERAAPSRVVMVASEAHRHAGRWDVERLAEPGAYGPVGSMRVYGRSKLLNILFAQELAERAKGVIVNAVCPGLVATGLVRDVPGAERAERVMAHTPLVRTPAQGARMVVKLATEGFDSGRFYSTTPGGQWLPVAAERKDAGLRRAVWERSEALVRLGER
ncbi:SDR family NAD(P)-dependent oxidoreductase [Actinomadura viridis]|uniref:NAD(P)-dependent dehydrogenase (Short-subunit alcohol dehydrogenase family) n=1 Tax=Actinomadura viridis TaxID=58110 RepID=A0A931DAU2_9ACTN|nr:SDR family NAD(P)-dependent oxidoreductase [Actinomadura viridis]MBG6086770.1 NAD(P)-dependent dehydrogenase (short-subunit alcohol dehydrogenase family) [Actinomadura viridis]